MMKSSKFTFILALVVLSLSPASFAAGKSISATEAIPHTSSTISTGIEHSEKSEYTAVDISEDPNKGQVAILWFPKTRGYSFTTVKLLVGDDIWNTEYQYVNAGSYSLYEREIFRNRTRFGFYRINLEVTKAEQEKLSAFLQRSSSPKRLQSCIGGVVRALSEATPIHVLPIFPTFALGYLYFENKFGICANQIESIEYIGSLRSRRLFTLNVVNDTVLPLVVAGLGLLDLYLYTR